MKQRDLTPMTMPDRRAKYLNRKCWIVNFLFAAANEPLEAVVTNKKPTKSVPRGDNLHPLNHRGDLPQLSELNASY